MGSSFGLRRINGRALTNSDGTTSIFCQTCGREICRRLDARITSITMCAVCQGNPEENVVAPYVQQSYTSPPVPREAEKEYKFLYGGLEDLDDGLGRQEEKVGTVRTVFRTVGFLRNKLVEAVQSAVAEARTIKQHPESKKIAIRKRRRSVFSQVPDDEQ